MTTTAAVAEIAACRRVTVQYGEADASVIALRDVDLDLFSGDRVALWGPSGSGKTTLLHVLGGLITPSSGEVLWQGRPLSSLDAAARGRARSAGIAYVFQGANLLPTFTAFENVAFAAHASAGHEQTTFAHGPAEWLELVGLASKLDSLASELSGGEAQRVAIARALAQHPALLLCDEPTGHLDSDTGARVLDLIDALQLEFGFTLVTATHDADVAARFERAFAIQDGRVVAEARFS
jgi:putative ABC transport system ATP-binding protein